MEGWIKLHRKLRENPIYSNPNAIAIWVECLLRASHEEHTFYYKRQKITLGKGQFLFGEEELGSMFNLSRQTARYWTNQFTLDNMLDIKKTSKGSIATIINWEQYQFIDSALDNKKTTKRQQKDTYNKDKNEKNDKKENYIKEKSIYYTEDFETFWNLYPRKIGKGKAFESWQKIPKQYYSKIIEVIPSHCNQEQWLKDKGQFIPHPSTWLNQRRWEDDIYSQNAEQL